MWPDATHLKVREGGRVVSLAAMVATALSTDGRRETLGLGPAEYGSTPDQVSPP